MTLVLLGVGLTLLLAAMLGCILAAFDLPWLDGRLEFTRGEVLALACVLLGTYVGAFKVFGVVLLGAMLLRNRLIRWRKSGESA